MLLRVVERGVGPVGPLHSGAGIGAARLQHHYAGDHDHLRDELEIDANGRIRRQVDSRPQNLSKSRVLDFDPVGPRIQVGERVEAAFGGFLAEVEVGIRSVRLTCTS